eukprot:7842757-Alexandrium_andersonii.AAC.1
MSTSRSPIAKCAQGMRPQWEAPTECHGPVLAWQCPLTHQTLQSRLKSAHIRCLRDEVGQQVVQSNSAEGRVQSVIRPAQSAGIHEMTTVPPRSA